MFMGNEAYTENLVSVIMPAYNSERYIYDSIKSVVDQSYKDWELIIYDDESTDDTNSILSEISKGNKKIKVIRGLKNSGAAVARNNALKIARGQYIAFLDSDDLWNDNKLEAQISFLNKNKYALCYSEYTFVNQDKKEIPRKKIKIKKFADYKALLKNNFIGLLTVCIDRKLTGDFEFINKKHEDMILWLNFIKKGHKLAGMNQNLAIYRVYGESLSGNKIRAAVWRWKVYRESENLSLISSMWYMLFYIGNSLLRRV